MRRLGMVALAAGVMTGVAMTGSVAQADPVQKSAPTVSSLKQDYPQLSKKIAAQKTYKNNLNFKIVGGTGASQLYGFVGSLQVNWGGEYQDYHICGSSLISGRYLVTNAHCVTDYEGNAIDPAEFGLHVRVGSNNRTTGGEVANVSKILVHPWWNWGIGTNPVADIALLYLDRYLDVQPIQVATKTVGSIPKGTAKTRILGWGVTEPDGTSPLPVDLRQLDTKLLKPFKCADAFISAGELCVQTPNNTDGACYGDSGGPAIQWIDGRWKLIGGTSRGSSEWCGYGGDVYTDLTNGTPRGTGYREWMYWSMRLGEPAPA